MKTKSIALLTLASTLAVIGTTTPLLSQDQISPTPPAVPEPPVPLAEPLPPRAIGPKAKLLLDDVRRQVDIALEQATRASGAAGDVFSFVGPDANFQFRPGVRPARSLVIPASDLDAETLATAEEDLNIMARILDKALPGRDDDKPDRRAMGIAISSPTGAAVRNLYLEGYGAVFFLDVRFPLLPPPKLEDQPKAKEPTSSAWEEARSELYSRRGTRGDATSRIWDARAGTPLNTLEEYDEDKVDRLKESLLDVLKNATHLRSVKPDESITLVINGGRVAEHGFVKRTSDRKPGRAHVEVDTVIAVKSDGPNPPSPRGTTMVIRGKKSDIDTFAKGDLDVEQFKKKVSTRIY